MRIFRAVNSMNRAPAGACHDSRARRTHFFARHLFW